MNSASVPCYETMSGIFFLTNISVVIKFGYNFIEWVFISFNETRGATWLLKLLIITGLWREPFRSYPRSVLSGRP
jgi:hypothetical protein